MRQFFLIFVLWGAVSAQAHPVTYRGGWSLNSESQADMNELMLVYSPSFNSAVGGSYLRMDNREFAFARVNWLVQRWNQMDSQGNLYLNVGTGGGKTSERTTSAHFGEVMADWESRKIYTSFRHQQVLHQDGEDFGATKLRAGFAPYLGDYEDLNVWWIAQWQRTEERKEGEAFQFLRFYLRNVLWEVGTGFNGNWAFNLMLHL